MSTTTKIAIDPQLKARIRADLRDRIIPYWLQAVDTVAGGYWLDDGPVPRRRAKQVVEQARLVWTFAHLHRHGFGKDDELLAAARHGRDYLRDAFLDREHGGYYWEVDLNGHPVVETKNLYAHSMVMMALAELGMAASDQTAIDDGMTCFETVQAQLRHESRGWVDDATCSWGRIRPGRPNHTMLRSGRQTLDTHGHVVEAFMTVSQATSAPAVRSATDEAVRLINTAFLPADPAEWRSCIDRRWSWRRFRFYRRPLVIFFGLIVETAWFLVRASEIHQQTPDWDRFDQRLDFALANGFDWERGGLYHSYLNHRGEVKSIRTGKTFWAQAEALVALAKSLERGPNERHAAALNLLISFVDRHMTDPGDGVWYEVVHEDGSISNARKSGMWKAGYHEVRALVSLCKDPQNSTR